MTATLDRPVEIQPSSGDYERLPSRRCCYWNCRCVTHLTNLMTKEFVASTALATACLSSIYLITDTIGEIMQCYGSDCTILKLRSVSGYDYLRFGVTLVVVDILLFSYMCIGISVAFNSCLRVCRQNHGNNEAAVLN